MGDSEHHFRVSEYSLPSFESGPGGSPFALTITQADSNDTVGFETLAPTISRVRQILHKLSTDT
jgi:hypothetical protein